MAEKKEDKKGKDEGGEGEAKPKSNKMMIIIVAVVALLVGGGGAGVAVMMMGDKKGNDKASEETEKNQPKKAFYHELKPPFVVNYQWNGRPHYLQVTFAVMARSEEVIDLVGEHMPAIRNNIMLLLSAQDFDGLRTMEGKEAVRQSMFDEIQKIVKENEENTEGIEQLYFINFVIQ